MARSLADGIKHVPNLALGWRSAAAPSRRTARQPIACAHPLRETAQCPIETDMGILTEEREQFRTHEDDQVSD